VIGSQFAALGAEGEGEMINKRIKQTVVDR